jgi:cellulose synthase/poly-beta-1,6-N-acetylglucosamine synthase-like glycosyltransferase
MSKSFVSIIVPTYKDWDRLSLCVEALCRQSYPRELYEVILVNNEPNDPAPPHFVLPPGFQMVTEATVGSYAARNAGLKVARGSIIG